MKAIKIKGPNNDGVPTAWPVEVISLANESDPAPEGYVLCSDASLDNQRRECFGEINELARQKVLALVQPDSDDPATWVTKEIDMVAKALLCVRREAKGTASAGDVSFLDALEALFSRVQIIRNYADSLKAAYLAGQTPDIRLGWPA